MTGEHGGTYVSELAIRAPAADVHAAALAPEPWLRGWSHLRRLDRIAQGDSDGVGRRFRTTVRAVLPYTLSWDMEVVRADPDLLAWSATGDLTGAGTWDLDQRGSITRVLSIWSVRVTRPWMRSVWPLARPLFVRNHDALMRRGAQRLAAHLDAELLRCTIRGR